MAFVEGEGSHKYTYKIYIQNHLIWKRQSDFERREIERVFVEVIREKAKSFFNFGIYRPPVSSKFLHSKFNALFRNLLSQLSLKECFLLGDSKVIFLKRSDNCEFESILQLFGFTQLICTPTRITNDTESLIDISASNNCACINDTIVVPSGVADHELIGCVRKLNHMKFPEETITCRDYRSYDPAKLSQHLSEVDWKLIFNCHDVSIVWRIFNDILSTVFNKFAPVITKRLRGKCSPRLSAEIKSHMSTKSKLMQKAQRFKLNAFREEYK